MENVCSKMSLLWAVKKHLREVGRAEWLMSHGHWTSQKWHQALVFLEYLVQVHKTHLLRDFVEQKPKAQPNLHRGTSLTCSKVHPKSSPFSNQHHKPPAPSDPAGQRQSSPCLLPDDKWGDVNILPALPFLSWGARQRHAAVLTGLGSPF